MYHCTNSPAKLAALRRDMCTATQTIVIAWQPFVRIFVQQYVQIRPLESFCQDSITDDSICLQPLAVMFIQQHRQFFSLAALGRDVCTATQNIVISSQPFMLYKDLPAVTTVRVVFAEHPCKRHSEFHPHVRIRILRQPVEIQPRFLRNLILAELLVP